MFSGMASKTTATTRGGGRPGSSSCLVNSRDLGARAMPCCSSLSSSAGVRTRSTRPTCRWPASSSASTTRPCPHCSGRCAASWTARRPGFSTRSSSWTTTATSVRSAAPGDVGPRLPFPAAFVATRWVGAPWARARGGASHREVPAWCAQGALGGAAVPGNLHPNLALEVFPLAYV